jgi:penicillin-binding protein 1C
MGGGGAALRRGIRIALIAVAALVITLLLALQFTPLPDRLVQPAWSRALYARDGSLLDVHIASDQQWRLPLPDSVLPPRYEAALLAYEDRYFHLHPGINPVSIARAALSNIRAGRVRQGGSTITMQLARLGRGNPPRTWANKLREAWLAACLEWRFDKAELLVHYATHAPFGGNLVGLHSASWRYFGRPPTRLSWAEAALLAVLPNSPGMLHPGRNRDALVRKRNRLLHRLHRQDAFDARDLKLALREALPPGVLPWPAAAPHLLQRMTVVYPQRMLFSSTLDAQRQRDLSRLLRQHARALAAEGVRNLALVVIDHRRMETVAYIGNATDDPGSGAYVDIAASPRSTGSILKPLLYGLMLQEGELLPTTLVADVPSNFRGYAPQNVDQDYRGAVPAREALAQSLNVPAVRMLRAFGVARFRERLQSFGLRHVNRSAEDYGLSLILGGAEASLWELATVYANLVHVAAHPDAEPRLRPALLLRDEQPCESQPLRASKAAQAAPACGDAFASAAFPLRSGAAWLTLQALINVVRPDADMFWRDFEGSQVIAWKTGTSFGLRDGWAIGSNGRYTAAVWTGNADGSPAATLGGAHSAGPVLMQVFSALGNSAWIQKPVLALKHVEVCADDGYRAAKGCEAITVSAPADSHFARATPFHRRIFLAGDGQTRVHAGCEHASRMQPQDWFVLPPAQEHFWRRNHAGYRRLPPWRADCVATLAEHTTERSFDLLYPGADSDIFIPLQMNARLGAAVFRAVHRDPQATLHWHLDGRYLGKTTLLHERLIQALPGAHTLVLVDHNGVRLERRFAVIGD